MDAETHKSAPSCLWVSGQVHFYSAVIFEAICVSRSAGPARQQSVASRTVRYLLAMMPTIYKSLQFEPHVFRTRSLFCLLGYQSFCLAMDSHDILCYLCCWIAGLSTKKSRRRLLLRRPACLSDIRGSSSPLKPHTSCSPFRPRKSPQLG